jgi:sulfite exporter TauE/SafE
VPLDLLMLSAAFLTGLLGSVHCLVMCAGVATGLAAATGAGPGRATLSAAVWLNLGRVLGYALAGGLVAGFGATLVRLIDLDAAVAGLRLLVGVVLVLAGLRLLDGRDRLRALGRIGQPLWQRLRPLTAHLLPATSAPRQLALGALWGWLPCGLSWTLLLAALFTFDAVQGAATLAAFGLGTLPAMLPLTWGSARLARRLGSGRSRAALGGLVIAAGLLTAAAPWLAVLPGVHDVLSALGCSTLPAG